MTKTYTTEIIRRVYDDTNGACIEVGPGGDGWGVEIRTPSKNDQDYFGVIRVVMQREMAIQLGNALIAAASEIQP